MQMSKLFNINGIFFHKSRHPSCCSGNLPTRIVTLGPSLKTNQCLIGYPVKRLPEDFGTSFLVEASTKVWQDGVFAWLWNLLTLSSAGKVSRVRWVWSYSPVQRIWQYFFTMCHFKLRYRKRRPFIYERDFRQNDFRTPRLLSTVFVLQNLDMMLGFQSRDKWSLNNYDAIEIKSKWFYVSSVTIPCTFRV